MKNFVLNSMGQKQILEEQPKAFESFLCAEEQEDFLHATHTERGDMLWHLTQDDSCNNTVALDKCRYSIHGCYDHTLLAFEDYGEETGAVTKEDISNLKDWLDNALYLANAAESVHIYGI